MAHTNDDTLLATAIRNIIAANKLSLGINDVLYGNQLMIPSASAVVVKASGKNQTLVGVQGPGGRTNNSLNIGIDIHRSKVGDEETERRIIDDTATAIEHLLNADVTVGGIIIHGYITNVDRGETAFMNNSMFRSVVMMYIGTTRTLIA